MLVVGVFVLALWRPLTAWWGDTMGNRALFRGQDIRAQAWFAWALAREPGWSLLHEDLGRALVATDPQRALHEFDIAACGEACSAEAGDALIRLGRPHDAIDRFIDAKAVGRVSNIALAMAENGDYDRASALIHDVIAKLQDNFLERADLASAYATLGRINVMAAQGQPAHAAQRRRAAIAAYGSASRLAPFNEGYLLAYAFAQLQWGDAGVARRAFEQVLELHPHQRDAEAALAALGSRGAATMKPSSSP